MEICFIKRAAIVSAFHPGASKKERREKQALTDDLREFFSSHAELEGDLDFGDEEAASRCSRNQILDDCQDHMLIRNYISSTRGEQAGCGRGTSKRRDMRYAPG